MSEEPSNETNSDETATGASKTGLNESNKTTSNGSASASGGERPKSKHFFLVRYYREILFKIVCAYV